VDTNRLTEVRQRPDPSRSAGSGVPEEDKVAFGYDPLHDLVVAVAVSYAGVAPELEHYGPPGLPGKFRVPQSASAETWTFAPSTGFWHREASPAASSLIVCGWLGGSGRECYPTEGRAVFDETSGLPVFMSRSGRIDAYDVDQHAWRTLFSAAAGSPSWCDSMPPVYDPLDRRIVCLEAGVDGFLMGPGTYPYPGVSAFSAATGKWRWLLEPSTTPPPTPTLAPGATPIDWGTPPPGWQPTPVVEPSVNPQAP
jgi:hypothetical protein